MSNITNSTNDISTAFLAVGVPLGSLFVACCWIAICCGGGYGAKKLYDSGKNGRTKRYNTPVQAYPVYKPDQEYPVYKPEIPEATSVSIVDSDENRKIFFKSKGINFPCSKKDLDLLEKLIEARKYGYIEVFYRNTRGISRGMYIIVQGAVYMLKYQFDENGELKQDLENPAYITVPKIPEDPADRYAGRTIYYTYKEWKKQGSKLKF